MKKRIFLLIVIIQIAIIFGILWHISRQGKQVLGSLSVNPIRKDDVVASASGESAYFFEPKPNTKVKDVFKGYTSYRSFNSDTLNERFDYSVEKQKGTYRIETIGSSFVVGLYVSTKDNWTEILEDKLNQEMKCSNISKFEVINLGVAGYDNVTTVERFKRRGAKYDPDMVLWYQTNNDMKRVDEKLWAKYYLENFNNPNKNTSAMNKAFTYLESFKLIQEAIMNSFDINRILQNQGKAMRSFTEYFYGPTILVINPGVLDPYTDLIKKIANEKKYYYFDNLRNFYNNGGYFVGDYHPNVKGHKMIAEDIFNYLRNSKIIPCE